MLKHYQREYLLPMNSLNLGHPRIARVFVFFFGSIASFGHPLYGHPHGSIPVFAGVAPDRLQVASMTNPVGVDRQTPVETGDMIPIHRREYTFAPICMLSLHTALPLSRKSLFLWV
jgi:hypothetical protein